MSTGESVCCVLWLSQLSPSLHVNVVPQIWQTSRERSTSLGLTGAMVFDGEHFCELLEGGAEELATVCRDVEFDSRHVGMRMLYAALTPEPRRLSAWHSGYCNASDLDVFCGPAGL
ncbi:MAG TPA: BLUF domain-containing protein, partial [Rhizobacter sp.]|nr:BLUF domain-containing protein [Rhizobacter sp.]